MVFVNKKKDNNFCYPYSGSKERIKLLLQIVTLQARELIT